MNIIVPMAGMGKRMRPHTLTVPKPLIPIAGKPIVQRLIEDIAKVCNEKIEEVNFIIGNFGEEIVQELLKIADSVGAKGKISYQNDPLGTAHAILCAEESLKGNVIVAFADTLFKADFVMDKNKDGIIWVHRIDDPSAFGVVKLDAYGTILDFVEKPKTFVSDLAIIGIYYFKSGETLKAELQYLLDNDIKHGGEYQLTDALLNMKNKGMQLTIGKVEEWLDCGNKNSTVYTNQRVLANTTDKLISDTYINENSVIVPPCYIGENVKITNSVIGPFTSIGSNTVIDHAIISNSIIQSNSKITHANLRNTMIGNFVDYEGLVRELNIGDYSVIG
jgi:glucose-1-phosphate thymidylyltransferase